MTDRPEPAAWTPPPPGDRREQLPDAVLALLPAKPYLSTACDTAQQLEQAPAPTPTSSGVIPDVPRYAERMHARCRLQHKFTGVPCSCPCHEPDDTDPDDLAGAWTPDPPIRCLTVTTEPTPSQRPDLHAQLADAIRTAACPGDCGMNELDCISRRIQPEVWHRGVVADVSGTPEMFASAVLALLYREWPWLRAGAEERDQASK